MRLSVYTPINTSYALLDKVYQSLIGQTTQDFVWLILDYGTNGEGALWYERFKSENRLKIKYVHQPFKGRFLATKWAMESADTPYLVGVDGNYILTPDAIDTLLVHWKSIENGKVEIAEIRARAVDESGNLIGKSGFNYDSIGEYVDSNWHTMVLEHRNQYEMLASWDRQLFLKAVNFNRYTLFREKYTELATGLFWSSLGRKYQTRYLSKALKVRVSEKIESTYDIENQYNDLVFNYYMLKDNISYFRKNPMYFFRTFIRLIRGIFKVWFVK